MKRRTRNLNTLRHALKYARELGCTIKDAKGDEICVSHPAHFRRVRLKATRSDTPRILLTMLHALENGGRSGPQS